MSDPMTKRGIAAKIKRLEARRESLRRKAEEAGKAWEIASRSYGNEAFVSEMNRLIRAAEDDAEEISRTLNSLYDRLEAF